MQDSFFRKLSEKEAGKFRAWARYNYQPGSPVSEVWHPVVREECAKINAENGFKGER